MGSTTASDSAAFNKLLVIGRGWRAGRDAPERKCLVPCTCPVTMHLAKKKTREPERVVHVGYTGYVLSPRQPRDVKGAVPDWLPQGPGSRFLGHHDRTHTPISCLLRDEVSCGAEPTPLQLKLIPSPWRCSGHLQVRGFVLGRSKGLASKGESPKNFSVSSQRVLRRESEAALRTRYQRETRETEGSVCPSNANCYFLASSALQFPPVQ